MRLGIPLSLHGLWSLLVNMIGLRLGAASYAIHQHPDMTHLRGLLRTCRKRPCCRRPAKKFDELASPHGRP